MTRSSPPLATRDMRRGIGAMLMAVSLFAAMSAIGKAMTEAYPLPEVVFFRNLFGIVAPFVILAGSRQWSLLRTRHIGGHVWRATIGMIAMVLTFWSLHLLPLADATALSFSSPLFVTALSVPVLGEKVGAHRWGAVLVGFAGVVVLARPSGDVFTLGAGVAVAGALAVAVVALTLRQLGRTEAVVTTVFYFSLFSTLYSALALPFGWTMPDARGWLLLIGMGLIGGLAQQFQTRAYTLVPAAVAGPFTYVSIVWATLFGWLVWGEMPGRRVLLGAVIVIGSGLYIVYRETVRRSGDAAAQVSSLTGPPSGR